ncbi:MAG: glycosyltransferase family 9 protein [Pirellulales bacterium]|nr:glycosyltransferase family 9 protein [Pirellulales bacterium]
MPDRARHSAPRVLIVRLSAIGDVIHGLPVLCALRRAWPEAHLTWVVERRASALLAGHAALDELILLPRGWFKSPGELWRLRRRLRQLRPDVTVDLQGLTKSAAVAWLSGCRRRIGFGDAKGRELSRWLNNELVDAPAAHVIDANLQLLAPLGLFEKTVEFNLPERAEDARSAQATIERLGLGEGYAMLNPGAGWPSKLWPTDRFAEVARHLGRQWRLPSLIVWAGAQERAWAAAIVAGAEGHARLAPNTSLTELAALARRAVLFVASDTGPLHVAAAVGTPCVGLFGPMPAERNGPYGPAHVALQKASFQGASRQRRGAPRAIMEAITVADVADACDNLLRRGTWEAA